MWNLHDDMARDLDNTFLDENVFAEAVIYTPKGGRPSELSAIVDQAINPRMRQEAGDRRNLLTVSVSNDPQSPAGGVKNPELGDSLKRCCNSETYLFTGRVIYADEISWELEFERVKQ